MDLDFSKLFSITKDPTEATETPVEAPVISEGILEALQGEKPAEATTDATEGKETPFEDILPSLSLEVPFTMETPTEAPTEATGGKEAEAIPPEAEVYNKLQIEADRRGSEIETARAVYGKYQDAIKTSEMLMADIMKAVNAGSTDYRTLLLQACEVVSLTTGNTVFYNHIKRELQ